MKNISSTTATTLANSQVSPSGEAQPTQPLIPKPQLSSSLPTSHPFFPLALSFFEIHQIP